MTNANSILSKVSNHPKSVLVLVALCVLYFSPLSSSATSPKCPKYGRRYGIMFDAGSTGSRVHVFDFTFEENGNVQLHNEVFKQLKPGLSSFKDDAKGAANSLVPLMAAALEAVPPSFRSCTPIELKATAGLRLLGPERSAAILAAVERLFRSYDFFVGPNPAIVMDGKDEGPYAWLTINFLLKTLFVTSKEPTAAIFDLGGASTQVVFNPGEGVLDRAPIANVFSLNLFDRQWNLYTQSHLGYGLKEAGKSIVKLSPPTKSFSCFPPGYTDPNRPEVSNTEGKDDAQNFDQCHNYAVKLLKKEASCLRQPCSFNGAYQPPLRGGAFKGPIYVFSYFYDRMEPYFNWSEESGGGESTIGALKELGRRTCNGGKPDQDHNKGTMCMDLAYLYGLLRNGYDLPDETPIFVKKKIQGIETAWCLGAMILAMG